MGKAIEIKEICKSFGEKKVLDGISFSVENGEIFGLLGPSGAGKTTLIRILTGQLKGERGEALVNGINSSELTGRECRQFGIMMDDFGLYERLSCFDNLKVFAGIYGIGKSRIYEVLEAVGLGNSVKKAASELSKGMSSRLRLARVLLHNPDILFLDEPTSGLDPLMQKEFFDILKERHSGGATIFLSSHVLSEIQKNCSRAAIIKEGKLIALDSVENLSKTSAKRVVLHGVNVVPENISAKSVEQSDDSVSFLYNGSIKDLLGIANNLPIYDMTITEPDLEEIFMHYYEKGGEN